MNWIFLIGAILLNSAGNVLLKQFAIRHPGASLAEYADPYFVGGLVCFALNVLLYARALSDLPIEIAYPILVGLSVLLVSIAAVVLFKAEIGAVHVVGMALILAGVALLARVSSP